MSMFRRLSRVGLGSILDPFPDTESVEVGVYVLLWFSRRCVVVSWPTTFTWSWRRALKLGCETTELQNQIPNILNFVPQATSDSWGYALDKSKRFALMRLFKRLNGIFGAVGIKFVSNQNPKESDENMIQEHMDHSERVSWKVTDLEDSKTHNVCGVWSSEYMDHGFTKSMKELDICYVGDFSVIDGHLGVYVVDYTMLELMEDELQCIYQEFELAKELWDSLEIQSKWPEDCFKLSKFAEYMKNMKHTKAIYRYNPRTSRNAENVKRSRDRGEKEEKLLRNG
ncbi:hypothetical protein Tco_0503595 [Tanacetum coccineum]